MLELLDKFLKFYKYRDGFFSHFWYKIAATRIVLCGVIAMSLRFDSAVTSPGWVVLATGAYLLFLILSGFAKPNYLRKKRIRIIPALLDILFTSILIYFTGGQSSVWFLLYVFPIFSVSRYLGTHGSLFLALAASSAYFTTVAIAPMIYGYMTSTGSVFDEKVSLYQLAFKCLILFCIGLVAGNLTKPRKIDDDDPNKDYELIEIFREIDSESLSSAETDKVSERIIEKVVRFLGCDYGEIRIYDDKKLEVRRKFFDNLVHKIIDDKRGIFNNSHFARVFKSEKKETILELGRMKPFIRKSGSKRIFLWIIKVLNKYPSLAYAVGNIRARFFYVPIILKGEIVAIIALYFSRRIRHLQFDRLDNFAPFIAFALDKAKLFEEKVKSDKEKMDRLKTLYAIGEQLKVEKGLDELFEKVVELTYNQLNSEEAAIFILDEKNRNRLVKKSVWGPSKDIARNLRTTETFYEMGDSLVGKIFSSRQPELLLKVARDVMYYEEYRKRLPSRKVCHYIGVPLIIGDEALGVIRIINKRAPAYSIEKRNFELSEEGFDEADKELLQTIASQVAAAIRSAKFIEVQKYYENLIENSPDPIIVIDANGFVTVFNRACEEIWGFTEEEVLGTHVTKYYRTAKQAIKIGKLLKEKPHQVHDYVTSIKPKNGKPIPISLSASNLYDKSGQKIASIGVFKDQRETNRLLDEKSQAERLATLGRLAQTVGHDVKHRIAEAKNLIDVLAFESRQDKVLSDMYEKIETVLSEAIAKFQNMLSVGKPTVPEKQLLGARNFVLSAAKAMRPRATVNHIDFVVSAPENGQFLEADEEQLNQVLFNLFYNSIDAIKEKKYPSDVKPQIILSSYAANKHLYLKWEDNGCGISPRKLAKIFTPFVSHKKTGNGLGLFIVKSIVENHRGDISVKSIEKEKTVFDISFPLYKRRNISK